MKRTSWLVGAGLLGGLMALALAGGLRTAARAAAAHTPLAAVGPELLVDPGFEEATAGLLDRWDNWGGAATQTEAPVHGGAHAARFESNTSSTKWVYQITGATGGDTYVFSAWALKDDPHIEEVYLRISWYESTDGEGTQIDQHDSTTRLTVDQPAYRFLTTGPIAAPASARSARVRLMLNPADGTRCVAYFDDASLRRVDEPEHAADLSVAKSGPTAASRGSLITYYITLSNTGLITATSTRLTDTLPTAVDFITQTSPFIFARSGRELLWHLVDVAPDTTCLITLTGRVADTDSGTFTNRVTATTRTTETVTVNNTDECVTAVTPRVRLYALAPVNHGGSGESAAIINLDSRTVSLDGWRLNDDLGPGGVSFPTATAIGPGEMLWLAQDADGFYPVWGFDADWAAQAITRPVSRLNGSWPIGLLADGGGAAYLLTAGGHVADSVAYGSGSIPQGWIGPAVPYPYAGYGFGQVLYRKLDQSSGLPVPDTDQATNWAQDPGDPIDGRKLRYPGWELEDGKLFFPAEITATTNFTLAVAPEGSLALVSRTIRAAQYTLRIQAYTLKSPTLCELINDRMRAGVVVTILLESTPRGGMEDVEKWIVQRLHRPPSSTVYFIGATAPRYRFQHAKFILIDDRLALVSTENFGENGMPSDRKDNGTMGHRGVVAVTDSPGVVARLGEIFRQDCDPRHADVAPYDDTQAPPDGFTPLPPPDWTTYTAPFAAPLATTATHVTVLHAPEHALRDRDSLLGLLARAGSGDSIAALQMSEPFTWTASAGWAGLNPRLQALIATARTGASVRVLLDDYYDDPLAANSNTATCVRLNGIAAQEGLSLTCRLGNVTGLGIHAKVFLVSTGEERWVHIGSINGTENSNKCNREVALQFRSAAAHGWMRTIFDHDWNLSYGPMIHRVYLPLMTRDYVPPADHPLVTEVLVNPDGDDTGKEWVEVYNPGPEVAFAGWTLGDAIDPGDYGDGRYAFPAGARLAHGQVIVAAACATDFATAYGFNPTYEWTDCDPAVPDLVAAGAWGGFGMALGNGSDEVLLLDAEEGLVDSAAWGGGFRAGVMPFTDFSVTFPSGASLKRYPPGTDRDDCARDFYVSYKPSPGVVAGN